MSINYIALGKTIKAIRLDKKMTQKTLADKINISYSYLSYIESGSKSVSLEVLVSIADSLTVSIDDLLSPSLCFSR